MAQIIYMPQLGNAMEEGEILGWRKKEGEQVRKGEILLEIMTDKASQEVEATEDGVLRAILAAVGDTIPIRRPIAIIGSASESIDHLLKDPEIAESAAPEAAGNGASVASGATAAKAPALAHAGDQRVKISPRARRIAEESGVALADLVGRGTGPAGRVVERDVAAYLADRPAAGAEQEERSPRATPLAARLADDLGFNLTELATGLPGSRVRREDVLRHAESIRQTPDVDVEVAPFAGMRRLIAENVSKSAFSAPHVTLTMEVDMTETMALRERILPEIERIYGARVSYNDILIKVTARALDEHPALNSALVGDELRTYKHKNIGLAVALDRGLITPVVKHVEEKSLGAVAAEMKELVERARTGKFTPADLADGTFTISNLGIFGIEVFNPIINPPQAAILGVCRIAEKPVVKSGQVVVRSMMNLCLSFDHRVVDGAPAAKFLQRIKQMLENPIVALL
jgi:pyruvate dehydrogenase E2 component (dihydrolipoamide acetyltransferase)